MLMNRRTFSKMIGQLAVLSALASCGSKTASGKVTLQLNWFPGGENCYWYWGTKNGVFAQRDIELTIHGGSGSELAARILASGAADVAIMGADAFLGSRESGAPFVSMGVLYPDNPIIVYSLDSANITKVQDLKGKRIGMAPGANTVTLFRALLRKNAIPPLDVTEVSIAGSLLQRMLLDHQVDAVVGYSFDLKRFELLNISTNFISLSAEGLSTIGLVVVTREGSVSTLRELAFLELARNAFMGAVRNPDAAFDALAQSGINIEEPAFERAKLDMVIELACRGDANCNQVFSQDQQMWHHTIEVLLRAGVITQQHDPMQFLMKQ